MGGVNRSWLGWPFDISAGERSPVLLTINTLVELDRGGIGGIARPRAIKAGEGF